MNIEWRHAVAAPAPSDFVNALRPLRPITAQVLFARGFDDPAAARAHWGGAYECIDPAALPGMAPAVDRILSAVEAGEPIAVYGDYDCDGVTACALLATTLRALGAEPRVSIPDRFTEGYGLHVHAIDRLADDGVRLIVTVDCGARAVAEARHARARGVDLIITDHHALGPTRPAPFAFVSPYGDGAGSEAYLPLAGVGLAFRLAQNLLREARRRGCRPALTERSLLDLVAIGTIADVAPMRGQNRALVRAGIDEINVRPRLGLRALLHVAGVRRSIDAECVGYRLAPLLNAAGRVGSARDAYELLMASDDAHAERLATALLEQNARRRAQTERLIDHVERTAGVLDPDAPLVFTSSDDYAVGVIGPAAARIAERFGRPAVVATWCGDEARGSCRSVPGFHITEALDRCTDLLTRHGGHAAAAGFCMPRDALPALRDRLTHIAAASRPRGGWSRVLTIDAEAAPGDLGPALYRELAALEPHGADNPRPLLLARRMSVVGVQTFGHAGAHLRLRLRECGGAVWTALAWRSGARVAELLSEKQSAAARVAELLSEKQSAAARVAELLSDPPLAIDVLFHLAGEERDGELRLWLDVQDFRAAQ